jgi:hypothetical protein
LLKRRLATYEWIEVEWNNITAEECMKLIESIPRRIAAVLIAKGGYAEYENKNACKIGPMK